MEMNDLLRRLVNLLNAIDSGWRGGNRQREQRR